MFYSATEKGFYSTDIHGVNIPSDAVEIEYSFYRELLQAQSEGRQILSGEDGYPYSSAVYIPALAERRIERWELIKAYRDDLRFNGGVKVGTNWFYSTGQATGEYNTLLLLSAGIPDTTVLRAGWRTMNGALVDMTPALVKQILTAGFAQVAAIDDVSQSHKAAMEQSATPETYDFSAGWPVVYVP